MDRYPIRRRKGGGIPEFAESGVSAEIRSHPRQMDIRLLSKVSMGGILDIAAQKQGTTSDDFNRRMRRAGSNFETERGARNFRPVRISTFPDAACWGGWRRIALTKASCVNIEWEGNRYPAAESSADDAAREIDRTTRKTAGREGGIRRICVDSRQFRTGEVGRKVRPEGSQLHTHAAFICSLLQRNPDRRRWAEERHSATPGARERRPSRPP